MKHDPWKAWSDAVALLGREESHLQIGAIAVMERLTSDNNELASPTVEVLKSALRQWESQEPSPPADVKAAAERLAASLADEGPGAGRRHWLRRLSSRRPSDKTT